jgi:Co/Zn/Cd efflux system component
MPLNKTVFRIAKMDCPSEEQMIRMKLSDLDDIQSLEFDIPNRTLTALHDGSNLEMFRRLNSLKFDTTILREEIVSEPQPMGHDPRVERRLLIQVLAINVFFFLLEMATGIIAFSMGLVADSLDMLADSLVYGMALYAVGGVPLRKKKIARFSGYLQLFLALLGAVEVVRRFVENESMPSFQVMVVVSLLALLGNATCLYLLNKSKSQEAHMQASMIFTSNDVIVNIGVIVAGALVYFTQSGYPDLVVGSFVFLLVVRGAIRILRLGAS